MLLSFEKTEIEKKSDRYGVQQTHQVGCASTGRTREPLEVLRNLMKAVQVSPSARPDGTETQPESKGQNLIMIETCKV